MAKSVTDYLINLEKLTHTNLELLQALNDSFHSKQDYLAVTVEDTKYTIPSFISLENKLNSLQENFTNLIHAPESGEAFFYMNGNSRAIEVRSYDHTPDKISLPLVENFNIESNNAFKDFLTPTPYIKFSLQSLPNDITSVVAKKIIPLNNELKQFFIAQLNSAASVGYAYNELYKKISLFKKGEDYTEYDKIIKLPIRKSLGTGVYVINKIVSDEFDENLNENITIQFKTDVDPNIYINSLSYKLFDETVERPLKLGDELVTYDSSAKMKIIGLHPNTNSVTVQVMNGEYLNLVEAGEDKEYSDLSKLKFALSPKNFEDDKFAKVPLEEDQYVFISLAPLNERMNLQAPWGNGLIVNTYSLTNGDLNFNKYYEENVRNIGDILFEMTSVMNNTLTKYSKEQYELFSTIKPEINTDNLIVYRINKHLDDSKPVQNIRSLYSQKQDYIAQLGEIQEQINMKNEDLASISFDDTTGIRKVYTSQLNELNSKRNELSTAIEKTIQEISTTANNSEVPIENAKYRIRGFFDYDSFIKENELDILTGHIKGIHVEYRYKNANQEQSNALSINGKFLFSDWNIMKSIINPMIPEYKNASYSFKPKKDNSNINEPSFNQIDIPISQGETVDIRLKVIYDMGYPFIEVTSDWSQIVNVEFPVEFLKDIQILDIINENNNDIETNRFNNIIKETGITSHLGDEIMDQDIKYFHKPESIASGFYTAERRIIPLKDKLTSIDTKLTELYDEVHDSATDAISVSIINGETSTELFPFQMNQIGVAPYDTFLKKEEELKKENEDSKKDKPIEEELKKEFISEGNYIYETENGIVTTTLNLNLHNGSNHSVKVYSMFPGKKDVQINNLKHTKFFKEDFYTDSKYYGQCGVWIAYRKTEDEDNIAKEIQYKLQTANQFITFRINDVNDGTEYYSDSGSWQPRMKTLSSHKGMVNFDNYLQENFDSSNHKLPKKFIGAFMYPILSNEFDLCINSNDTSSCLIIPAGGTVTIPILFEYKIVPEEKTSVVKFVEKTMSFDIRTSLYRDPINYTFKVTAKNMSTMQDKITSANQSSLFKDWVSNKLIWPWTRYNVLTEK